MKEYKTFPFITIFTTSYYDPEKGKTIKHRNCRVGFCETYSDAVSQIEDYCGDELNEIEYLVGIGEKENAPLIPIREEWIADLIYDEDYTFDKKLTCIKSESAKLGFKNKLHARNQIEHDLGIQNIPKMSMSWSIPAEKTISCFTEEE